MNHTRTIPTAAWFLILPVAALVTHLPDLPLAAETAPLNLALEATASASESFGELTAPKANDHRLDTRWSGVPGHNEGVWFQLDWPKRVHVGEVIVHQYDRYVMELDLQVLDPKTQDWRTVRHLGQRGKRLPRVIAIRVEAAETAALRIANITNGPSFTEVEVYEKPFTAGITTRLASDLRGSFIGVVTDSWGADPVEGARVILSGQARQGPWTASAISDSRGLFSVGMPLGLEGPLRISTALDTPTGNEARPPPTQQVIDAIAFQYGLTPRGGRRDAVSLNGKWKFAPDPPDEFWSTSFDDAPWREITVPSHWTMEGFSAKSEVAGYRRRFTWPPGEGKPTRARLLFEGVYSGAEVWVNGRILAAHEGGATPFEVDVTDALLPGENLLAVRVREHTGVSDELDKMSLYADFPLAGIFRPVHLFRVAEVRVGDLAIHTTFDREYRDATLSAHAAVLNESPRPFRGALRLELVGRAEGSPPPDGSAPIEAIGGLPVEVGPWGRVDLDVQLPVRSPEKWTAETPALYWLAARLEENGDMSDLTFERIGFRQTEIRGPEILVNGRPVKLRGTCHHDTHPLLGRAVSEDLILQDVRLMKQANLNAVRTSHYPPAAWLLDLADEHGLYVEDEAPFCWVGVSNDLRLTPRIIQLTAELLARDRNHPSVVFWSLCNESEFGYGFERSHEWLRAADPSRPTSAGTSARTEIATLHNPIAISRMDENESLELPLLFDESLCIFQGIFNDVAEMWVDPGIRDYYAAPLQAIFARFLRSRSTQGSFIWCWADDLFCVPGRGLEYGRGVTRSYFVENAYRMPGRGITGDAPWGVVDGWRRQKPEHWITKKLHSPVAIAEGPIALPKEGEPIRLKVENRYDFVDLSSLEIGWKIEGKGQGERQSQRGDERGGSPEKGRIRASIPPRSSGVLEIRPRSALCSAQMLALEFRDSKGLVVDAYRLPLGEEPPRSPPLEDCTPTPLEIRDENVLAGVSTRVMGGEFELSFDSGTGLLRRCAGKGEVLLLEFPTLHVLPTRRPLSPLPDRLSWKLGKLDVKRDGRDVRVSIQGSYEGFRGGYELVIAPSGEIGVSSSFERTGDDLLAREIGLRFSVPRECGVLEWDRRAEWSVYPGDHIGRPRGTARAFAGHSSKVPPEWPWSEDDSPMGSNDFRSTKRNVYWASIHYPEGPAVGVVDGGGRKHVRAMVESDRISVHVSDWYGGTNVGWWEWVHNYGEGRPIAKGEVLTSAVRLRIGRFGRLGSSGASGGP